MAAVLAGAIPAGAADVVSSMDAPLKALDLPVRSAMVPPPVQGAATGSPRKGFRPYSLKIRRLPGCPGGTLLVASFRLGEELGLVVLQDGSRTLPEAKAALAGLGLEPAAVVNGGYFDRATGEVLSYYKSSRLGTSAPSNSSQGPRACMVFDPATGAAGVYQSTEANYRLFRRSGAEVYCAGPQLLEDGADVAARQYCRERFSPACRPDRSDPGLQFFEPSPRTGSCAAPGRVFKLFSANSAAARCGLGVPDLARAMAAEGCRDGLNHDGGGSAKLYLSGGDGPAVVAAGAGTERSRRLPVWIAVVRGAP